MASRLVINGQSGNRLALIFVAMLAVCLMLTWSWPATGAAEAREFGAIKPLNVVIGSPGAPSGAQFTAPTQNVQGFDIDLSGKIPGGSQVLAAWYVPIANLPDIAGFSHIEVIVAGEKKATLKLKAVTGSEALLRILIYAVYGPK